MLGSKKEQEIF